METVTLEELSGLKSNTAFIKRLDIKLPVFNQDQKIIRMKLEAGVLLSEKDYKILGEEIDNFETEEQSKNYLKMKYNVNFDSNNINKMHSCYHIAR